MKKKSTIQIRKIQILLYAGFQSVMNLQLLDTDTRKKERKCY